MNQTVQMLLILVGAIGAVVAFGLITQWMAAAPRGWKELAARYRPQQPSQDAQRSIAKVRFLPEGVADAPPRGCLGSPLGWWGMSKGYVQASLQLDDTYLHLDLDSGAAGPRSPMSIPWSAIETGQRGDSVLGEHIVLRVDEFDVLMPTAAIERELEVRQMLEAHAAEAQPELIAASMPGAPRSQVDAALIDKLRQRGVDPSTPLELEFTLYFPSESAARAAVADLGSRFDATAEPTGVPATNEWLVLASRTMAPEPEPLREIQEDLELFADRRGGRYDGWVTRLPG